MAGSEIWIAEGGFVMIHEVRGGVRGQADDLRRMADVLDLVSQTFVDTYTARTKQEASKIKKWMADETWFNSKDAVANGFADHISENMKVAASIADPSRFTNLPAALRPGRQRIEATLAEMRAAIK
jgi:ATP-dependent Clp protease protease subunit